MPIPAVVVAAGIAAAASLAAAKQQSSAASSATGQGRVFALDMYGRQRRDQARDLAERRTYAESREDTILQRTTADARAAGLHPLFALGGTPGYSAGGGGQAGISIPGYPQGGTGRTGIGRAGAAIAKGITQNETNQMSRQAFALSAQRVAAEVMRDEAQANYYNAMAAKASQEANAGPRMDESGATVYPIGERPGVALKEPDRPTRVEPNVNVPLWTTVQRGKQKFRVLNEGLQADEINQFLIYAQGSFDYFHKSMVAIGFKPWEVGRQTYKLFQNWHRSVGARRKARGTSLSQPRRFKR